MISSRKASVGQFFGDKLKQLREEKGVSAYRISQLTGVPTSNITAVEKGRRPPSDSFLKALADIPELETTIEDLLTWADIDRLGPEGMIRVQAYLGARAAYDAMLASVRASEREMVERLERAQNKFLEQAPHARSQEERDALARELDQVVEQEEERLKQVAETIASLKKTTRSLESALSREGFPKRKETSDAIAQVVAQLPKDMKHPPTDKELKLLEKIGGFDGSELDPRSGSWLWTQPPEKRKPDLQQALRDWKELGGDDAKQA